METGGWAPPAEVGASAAHRIHPPGSTRRCSGRRLPHDTYHMSQSPAEFKNILEMKTFAIAIEHRKKE